MRRDRNVLDERGGVGSRQATARVAVIVGSTLLHEEDCRLLVAIVFPDQRRANSRFTFQASRHPATVALPRSPFCDQPPWPEDL